MTHQTLSLSAGVDEGPNTYEFHTADGVDSPGAFRTAELVLLRAVHDSDPGDHLAVEANYGVVGIGLAPSADSVRMVESSARRATLCRRNGRENDTAARTTIAVDLSRICGSYDTASYAPRSHTPIPVGKQRIADALEALQPGGRLFVAASRETGRSRYADCLEAITDSVQTIRSTGDWDVLVAERPTAFERPQYVTPTPFESTVAGVDLSLVFIPGMFAAGTVDDGTRLLAETATVADGDRGLDLCCGAGPLGIYAARAADCTVTLTDDSRVATRAAACSVRRSGVTETATVLTADGTTGVSSERFDTVLCNPPTHGGSGVLSDVLAGARRVLARSGRLYVVHHAALDLGPHLRGFGTVEKVAASDEHVVLRATQ